MNLTFLKNLISVGLGCYDEGSTVIGLAVVVSLPNNNKKIYMYVSNSS